MQAFCCCSSRRRGRLVSGQDNKAASSLPVSSPAGLAESRFDWSARKTKHPAAQPNDVPASAQVSPCEGPVELCQLVADNDSDSHDDTSQSAKRSTGTLEVVRSKLIRHMPQDNEVRRQSRLAAGHSEEELARRAELRRFRQQRIQDELDKDKSNDEGSESSHRSTRYLSPLIQLGQSGIGPRDTIEFTVDDTIIAPDNRVSGQQQDSYQSTRLDRVLGIDNEFDIRRGSHAWDDQSALGVWLMAQGMRSRDCSLIRLGDAESDRADDCERLSPPLDDFNGIDRVIDIPNAPRGTSPPESPPWDEGHGNFSPSQCPCQCGDVTSSNLHVSASEDLSIDMDSSNLPPADHGSGSAVKQPLDNVSSYYPSALPSFQPSPDGSTNNNFSLSPQDIESLELSPIHWHGKLTTLQDFGHSEGQSSYATAEEEDTLSARRETTAAMSHRHTSQVGSESNSTVHSETKSFQQREAELQTIEQRFGHVLSRKQVDIPLHSRFREEFTRSTTQAPAKTSLATKLHNSISRLSRAGSEALSSMDNRRSSMSLSPEVKSDRQDFAKYGPERHRYRVME
ncbi:hypothetical protein HRG_007933 [Hirsutella rhossiliensis]|uniref:Uncharacterized protein n=1 Tax=Hirsutella rhossiliensis TaxID=111463 RepID=A0A9P8MT62_9HYPO|nr:uncharacterized protein HRG_07933 [Hirsutella rhossiliensis]KAH0960780.1 hypothetical protein HRG_07933 [Hirsutella rhossiliensis]